MNQPATQCCITVDAQRYIMIPRGVLLARPG
jgi:hypothetical protein